MRIDGTLAKWNDDRGFGFIAPTEGGPEIFAHISAFPKDGQRPRRGEPVSFEIEIDKTGRKRAKNILCPTRSSEARSRRREPGRQRAKQGIWGRVVPLIVVVTLGAYGYGEYTRRPTPQAPPVAQPANHQEPSPRFQCDGRTHCSQMTSCAEAKFFLKNCPGAKMDGNDNGVPCEQQWCTGPFAK
jgi:cold shock CspA family protein